MRCHPGFDADGNLVAFICGEEPPMAEPTEVEKAPRWMSDLAIEISGSYGCEECVEWDTEEMAGLIGIIWKHSRAALAPEPADD